MDFEQSKLFIGGISWDITEETLNQHFNKYGDVVESVIVMDRSTGKKRGFAFVQFAQPSVADKVLEDKHVILGRTVEVKRAVPRGEKYQENQSHQQWTSNGDGGVDDDIRKRKIFVGGLPPNLTQEGFQLYFSKFGSITDVVLMFDKATQRPRGFGFITFESEEDVEKVMENTFHELNNKKVEVKRAVPRQGNNRNCHNGNNNYNNGYNRYNGGGSYYNGYSYGLYPPYDPNYAYFRGYAPSISSYGNAGSYLYGATAYGNGYGYPWNVSGMAGYGGSIYNNTSVYNTYINTTVDGVMDVSDRSYDGTLVRIDNKSLKESGGGRDAPVDLTTLRVSDEDVDNDLGFIEIAGENMDRDSDFIEIGAVKNGTTNQGGDAQSWKSGSSNSTRDYDVDDRRNGNSS